MWQGHLSNNIPCIVHLKLRRVQARRHSEMGLNVVPQGTAPELANPHATAAGAGGNGAAGATAGGDDSDSTSDDSDVSDFGETPTTRHSASSPKQTVATALFCGKSFLLQLLGVVNDVLKSERNRGVVPRNTEPKTSCVDRVCLQCLPTCLIKCFMS